MDVDIVFKEVLRDLVLQYQQDQDVKTFEQLLKRVDRLILFEINKMKKKYPLLSQEEGQDLYGIAIVGLYSAIAHTKAQDSPDEVLDKIIRYVKLEIKETCINFPSVISGGGFVEETLLGKRTEPPMPIGIISQGKVKDLHTTEREAFHSLEYTDINEVLENMVTSGMITQEDLNLVKLRFWENLTYKEIAKRVGGHFEAIRRKMRRILNLIRHQMRISGIENAHL